MHYLAEEFLEEARVGKALVKVTVTRRVPRLDVSLNVAVFGHWQQRFSVDAGEAALVKSVDVHLEALVLANHLLCVLVRVERVHQD